MPEERRVPIEARNFYSRSDNRLFGETHLSLWEQKSWRYAFLLGAAVATGRSGTASRYVAFRLLVKEYKRGAIMRVVKEDRHSLIRARLSAPEKDAASEAGTKLLA